MQIATGELLAEAASHNGTPPQILGAAWSPGPLQPAFISRDLPGPCDLLCSIGTRHLKFWAFQRHSPGAPLLSRSHKMGKVGLRAAAITAVDMSGKMLHGFAP